MSEGKMISDGKVLIVIPAQDEEASIGNVLEEIKGGYPSVDVLVVDDGSEDATAEISRAKGVKVISYGEHLGVAAAIQTGRNYALDNSYDFLVFIDADGQHNPSDIGKILAPLIKGKADFVVGSRELGDYDCQEPLRLKWSRYFCCAVTSLVLWKWITDPTSGFRGWNRKVIEDLRTVYETSSKLHLSTTHTIEEVLAAAKRKARIVEVPVKMFGRKAGLSKTYTTETWLHFVTLFPLHLIRTVLRNLT